MTKEELVSGVQAVSSTHHVNDSILQKAIEWIESQAVHDNVIDVRWDALDVNKNCEELENGGVEIVYSQWAGAQKIAIVTFMNCGWSGCTFVGYNDVVVKTLDRITFEDVQRHVKS